MSWVDEMFPARWGDVALAILSGGDEFPREVVTHSYPYRDGGNNEDTGGDPRESQVQLVFFGAGHLQRLKRFKELYDLGEPQLYTHPLLGAFQARAFGFRISYAAETRDYVEGSCTFVEEGTEPAVFDVGELMAAAGAAAAVGEAGAALDAELTKIGLSSPAPAAAVSIVDGWTELATINAQLIALQVAEASKGLRELADALDLTGLATDYPVILGINLMLAALTEAASAFLAESPVLTSYTVPRSQPLLSILAAIYGAALTTERFDEVLQLNRIRNPAYIEAGTVLVVAEV